MKIYAPVKDFNGLRNNVRFVNGVGETDNVGLTQWFVNHGYTVEEPVEKCEEIVEKPMEKCDESIETTEITETNENSEPDFDAMTPNEIREWMKINGYATKMKNIRSKEKLIEIIRG